MAAAELSPEERASASVRRPPACRRPKEVLKERWR